MGNASSTELGLLSLWVGSFSCVIINEKLVPRALVNLRVWKYRQKIDQLAHSTFDLNFTVFGCDCHCTVLL
jgi:hypothetical protein